MAIPDYFHRNAIAISQAVSGLDEHQLKSVLDKVCIGVTLGSDAYKHEGQAILDLLIRLLARLYPSIVIRDKQNHVMEDEAKALARQINPNIELSDRPTHEIVIGTVPKQERGLKTVFIGSNGWTANLSTHNPQGCGDTNNPYGAGIAACLAAAELFRSVFLTKAELSGDYVFTFPIIIERDDDIGNISGNIGNIVLAGAGAIGNSVAWALSRTDVNGLIEIIDHESVDLGNLQRYILAKRDDEHMPKSSLISSEFTGALKAKPYEYKLAEYLVKKRHKVDNLLLALDSSNGRRSAQASLPRRIANAWTQPGDLGVSAHNFLEGACVSCLYMPDGEQKNEDEIIAESLGVPDKLMDIRNLLYANTGIPRDLLNSIATARDLSVEKLIPFEGRPLRQLYTEGFCGGAVIPLGENGAPAENVHVPLAHQSALAGVLLAGVGVQLGLEEIRGSVVARYDVLRPQKQFNLHPIAKGIDGKCICQDNDYVQIYRSKYRK